MAHLLGSDPELMLMDGSGELRSAIPYFHGTKDKPELVRDVGALIHDNVNVEFGIAPAKNADEWVDRTGTMLAEISARLPAHLRMVARASGDFPDTELEHPTARLFACDPDFDPYSLTINSVPDGAENDSLRSCGGHVHIGHKDVGGDFDHQVGMAKAMDVFLGLPSMLLDKDPTSKRRRQLYGKAGAHRPKPYGVEYRAIGNFWVAHPKLTRLIYLLASDGIEAYFAGHLEGIKWGRIKKTINDGLEAQAKRAMNSFVRKLLSADTLELLDECLELPQTDVYNAWEI